MVYNRRAAPASATLEDLQTWMEEELDAISTEFNDTNALELRTTNRAPDKPRDGMIVHADGTHWDPGHGEGAYVFSAGAWNFLGYVTPADLTVYLVKASNLSDLTNAGTARSNLGLVIGTNVEAFDAQLFSNLPQNSKSAAYTTVLSDGAKHIFHPSADTTARIWTIDSNANVAYPIGTVLTFVNQQSAGVITIAITSDTMRLGGAGTTGSRTLAANGVATALKVATTEWIITGTGLT